MRLTALVVALATGVAYADEDCGKTITCGHWTTSRTYPNGTLRLNWTHIYEGHDTVLRIDFPQASNGPNQLKVEGQPVFNARSTVVALPYCADDGCAAKVPFVDLVYRREIGFAALPYEGQFYLKGTWKGDVFTIKVSIPDTQGGNGRVVTHRYQVSSGMVKETR